MTPVGMTLVLDTGPIVAALNKRDPDYARCAHLILESADLVIPSPALVEIDHWLTKLGGPPAWSTFVADVATGAYRVVHPTGEDLVRAADLERQYATLDLGFVDAATIALCERLDVRAVATLDRRHFSVVKPRHCECLTLLPE